MAQASDLRAGRAIAAGGPGFAPDFAGLSDGARFGPARAAGDLSGPAGRGFEKVTLDGERAAGHRRALFEREEQGSRGPHMLNRAFSGTYPEER